MNIEFNWTVKVDDDTTKYIEEKKRTDISSHQSYENLDFVVTINKNPKGGADIFVTNNDKSIVFEGYYQGHPSSLSLIRLAKNPLPGTR